MRVADWAIANRGPRRLDERQTDLEQALDLARRDIAELKLMQVGQARRLNATVDLYEQRIDRIYGRIGQEVAQAVSAPITIETESEIDDRLAALIRSGFEDDALPAVLPLASMFTTRILPGEIRGPLTMHGFRINRTLAREAGGSIEIMPAADNGGVVVYGPYKMLRPGDYRLTAELSGEIDGRASGAVILDVFSPASGQVVASSTVNAGKMRAAKAIALDFNWSAENARQGIEFRLHQRSSARISLTGFLLTARSGDTAAR